MVYKMKKQTITITINKEIYKKLAQMKLDKDLKTFDKVLFFIFNNQKQNK
jgi:predicted CopG family antitoxin